MSKELKIAMLGHRGVGKTSLLTAMYEQFDSTIGSVGLQLTPDPESSALLGERLGELKALLDDFEATAGLEGTENPQSFHFELGKLGARPSLKLTFQDFPGGYLNAKEKDHQEFIRKIIDECVVILIAIDAPALMAEKGKWNDLINRPKQICDFFARSYTAELKEPRLVILAPVRCEEYMLHGKETELLQSVKDKYAKLLNLLNSEALRDKVACVVTPVQTVGTVVFYAVEENKGRPRFFFRKLSHDSEYAPKDCDQPLRYLLSFLLKLHYDKRWGWLNPIRRWLGWDEYLKEAVHQASKDCKSTRGFAVLQGKDQFENAKK